MITEFVTEAFFAQKSFPKALAHSARLAQKQPKDIICFLTIMLYYTIHKQIFFVV